MLKRYFFDVDDGDGLEIDRIGLLCESLQAVREEAIKVLPDIAKEVMPDGDRRVLRTIVRDEGGRSIFEASLALDAHWLPFASDPQPSALSEHGEDP